MKFSVLLPTRNRLDLLKYAVESVRRQDRDNWEIIVSDNDSEDDIAGYVASVADSRIKYFRTPRFIPVTDNWNNALDKATGDYITMLGDDDCLMKGYFRVLGELLERFSYPDCVTTNAFLYAYPGVMPGHPDGYLQPYGYAEFFRGTPEPFLLEKKDAVDLVKNSMNLKLRFGYNMQYFAFSRHLVKSLEAKGKFFQSPYPDYYASNVLLLKADRILVCPHPLVTIGISPKSFGYYYFNRQENQGIEFLKNLPDTESIKHLSHILLPGTDMNTFWMLAMETIQSNYGSEFPLKVGYRRYRLLQIIHIFRAYHLDKTITRDEFTDLWRRMRLWEKIIYGSCLRLACVLINAAPPSLRKFLGRRSMSIIGQYPEFDPKKNPHRYRNILEVFESVDPFGPTQDT